MSGFSPPTSAACRAIPKLADLLIRDEAGEKVDQAELARLGEQAVRHVVRQQTAGGVDVINDGEQPRVGFQTYVPSA